MSKSMGNHVPLMTTPEDMYGKIMSVPDKAMRIYHKLLFGYTEAQLKDLDARMIEDPMGVKKAMAFRVVEEFYGTNGAEQGAKHFATVIQGAGLPDEMPEFAINTATRIVDILAAAGLTSSKGEARRKIQEDGVRLNGEKVAEADAALTLDALPAVLQVGKRKFVRVVAG
jgi:tyrosyl-tRNA synthetase